MSPTHGFQLIREEEIPELKTTARLYRHGGTGAELLSIINDDENKVFGINFRTPPQDSTGVAHILEHSVLCGSRKYPVKEPFVELIKGSLKTFLNAMTYPDKTCYPVASQNVQDFYNLIDVYMDAVFHPRLTREIFHQEGWHLEVDSAEGPVTYKGVVYNEMKGAYSSPDSLLAEYSQQSLFPENPYGFDSGGDPRFIPDLTYEQFKDFHRRYYHPSNSRIFFHGDDDPEKRLEMMEAYLREFESLEIDSRIPLQPSLEGPVRLTRPFDPGGDEEGMSLGRITVNWLIPGEPSLDLALGLHALEFILLGMPGSPLRKALIDSGLGEDLAGVGMETELRQFFFSTGLKGIRIEDSVRVEDLIEETLRELADRGIDPLTVEAALNTMEFQLRENNTGGYPRGLILMLRSLTTWLYDRDPLALVAFERPLAALKDRITREPDWFSRLIRSCFLENPHRSTVLLEPDPGLAQRLAEEENERLRKARETMGPQALAEAIEATKRLREFQEAPDPPEALAFIPRLKLQDLEPKNKEIPLETAEHHGTEILTHDLSTNGIAYLDLGFDLHGLRPELLQYARLFSRILLEMGTDLEDYVSLNQRISRKTGGIHTAFFASASRSEPRGAAWMFLRGKVISEKVMDLLDILRDVLLRAKLEDRGRLRQIVLQAKAHQEQRLIPAGHEVVATRLAAHFGEADWAAEQTGGISYLWFLRRLPELINEDWPGVLESLEEVRRVLVNRSAMVVNLTADGKDLAGLQRRAEGLLEELPEPGREIQAWTPAPPPAFEGLAIPAHVNYVGKGAVLSPLGYRFHGSALVIARHLRNAWLWDRIRVQGGAYGAFCNIDRLSSGLTFVSYRDPNLLRTLEAFDACGEFLRANPISREEL
ncbi:MAG: insulinase family protein, partial [Desulfobacteraceae bacterium]